MSALLFDEAFWVRRHRLFAGNQGGPSSTVIPPVDTQAITTEGGVEITTEGGQTLDQG